MNKEMQPENAQESQGKKVGLVGLTQSAKFEEEQGSTE